MRMDWLRGFLVVVAAAALLARYFLDQWFFANRQHADQPLGPYVWRMSFHGSAYFLDIFEYALMAYVLPGIALTSIVAVMLLGRGT